MSVWCHNRTHAAQQKNSYWIIASPSGPTGIAGISMPGRLGGAASDVGRSANNAVSPGANA